jgi:hypothetical protein
VPREIAHWTILHNVSTLLVESPELASSTRSIYLRAFRALPQAAFLGAISHDAPYYYKLGLHPFSKVAEKLHGSDGEDTLEALRKIAHFARHCASEHRQNLLNSFLLGFCSHVAVDAVFHPMVYYFTGNYYDPDPKKRHLAVARHRLFETHLERLFVPLIQQGAGPASLSKSNWTLGAFLSAIPSSDREFIGRTLARATSDASEFSEECLTQFWTKSFKHMSRMISLLHRRSISVLLSKLKAFDIAFLVCAEALCTWPRQGVSERLKEPLHFCNPITGEEQQATVFELADKSATLCLELLSRLHPALDDESPPQAGPSLNFGIPNAPVSTAKYFAPEASWLELGLS